MPTQHLNFVCATPAACAKLAHMADVAEDVLGMRIRGARERAGLKQGELASLVGLERTAISKIEGGVRKVTALELSDIASALGARMAAFLSEPLPALVSHRSSLGVEVADSQVDRLLAAIASDVEFVHSLAAAELGLPVGEETALPRPVSSADADKLAADARVMLGLDATAPVHDLVERVASIGLLVFSQDLGVDTADAGTILLRQGGVTLVNSHNKVGRRRLAVAHELGHFLVADDYTVDWRVADQRGPDIESRLDRFARSLLLPEMGVQAAWAGVEERPIRERAVLIASEFRVDMATLAKRLEELSLVDRTGATLIRGTVTTRADIVDFGLRIPTDLEGVSLPVPYQKAVLRAFRDEQVSRERALELLYGTFGDDDLPRLRARREDEIWNFVS